MMTRFGFVAVGALALGFAGCGAADHAVAAPASPPSSSDWGLPPPASPPPSVVQEGSAPAAAPRPSALPEAQAERDPAQRPGLGTEWGETRRSEVHEEAFVRDASDPFALARVRYDDRTGVEAMLARRGSTARYASGVPLARGWFSLSIRGEHGRTLDTTQAGDETYVVGRAGERYTIVLTNRTSRRFEAVATVDGLDVINGRTGSLANRGYLLEPHRSLEIDGFRQTDDTVAAFRFGRVADSYAAQTGSARDVGVIGVAFFGERGDRARDEEARWRETATPFPADGRYATPPY